MVRVQLWDRKLISIALKQAVIRLNPFWLYRNVIIFLVEIAAIITTVIAIRELMVQHDQFFNVHLSFWLWFTVFFANFAESFAETKGRAQAEELKKGRSEVTAQRLLTDHDDTVEEVSALLLKKGDLVLVADGMIIPSDGEIVEGVALVDESAITGESAPVVREAGGDRTGVTGGTKVLSGTIKVEIKANAGETFIDRMIGMIERTKRNQTSNEKTLNVYLLSSTLVFFVVVWTLPFFSNYLDFDIPFTVLIALFVCLIPTTIGGLLPAVGIAGMDHLLAKNVIALDSRAIESAGDVTVVLLDKTGTITLGSRLAHKFIPLTGITENELARYAMLSSLADDTPEGRSVVVLAKRILRTRGRDIRSPEGARFIEFQPETHLSGIDIAGFAIRKGSLRAIQEFALEHQITFPEEINRIVQGIAREGGTPLVVADQTKIYGVIYLRDILKKGIAKRLLKLKRAGILSLMVTGDNALTAAAIAAEAGADDFIAEATPLIKLKRIKKYQEDGYVVAMIGDGINDAPALAQADVAVAMNVGTQSAQEAANMIDLDSSPAKLLDIIAIGKQILITRGAITTFSIANDISKYFAILPAIFITRYPQLRILNIMQLSTPRNAVIAAIIFNALIIIALIPLALRGVKYTQLTPLVTLKRNLLIYGVGGIVLPFLGIKLIDMIINLI